MRRTTVTDFQRFGRIPRHFTRQGDGGPRNAREFLGVPVRPSVRKALNASLQILVSGMRVRGRGREVAVPGESLRQQDVLCGAVEVGDGRVSQAMEAMGTVEAGSLLPATKDFLGAALRQPVSVLR